MDTIISKAVEYGFDGVDFRGCMDQIDIFTMPEFSTHAKQTAERFRDANLEVTCFSSSATLYCTPEVLNRHLNEVEQYAKLCAIFSAPFIRVFGGAIRGANRSDAVKVAASNLRKMASVASDHNASILIETHDDWTACEHVKAILDRVDSQNVGVVWDVHHPYRALGEAPEKTWSTLGKWIFNTHWKDSYIKPDAPRGYRLCLLGEGDIPLEAIFQILKDNGYEGYLTLEWEKRWCPEIEEPEIAFPQFVKYMKGLIENN
jgi:sugar phosphate isomerase/epimerase